MSNPPQVLSGAEADAHWQSVQASGGTVLTQEVNRLLANGTAELVWPPPQDSVPAPAQGQRGKHPGLDKARGKGKIHEKLVAVVQPLPLVICYHCASISLRDLATPKGWRQASNVVKLRESARVCRLCFLLYESIRRHHALGEFSCFDDIGAIRLGKHGGNVVLGLDFEGKMENLPPQLAMFVKKKPSMFKRKINLDIVVDTDVEIKARPGTMAAALELPVLQPIPPSSSTETMEKIASWINTCYSTHACTIAPFIEQTPENLPKRLLRLGEKHTDVRLVDTATLSPEVLKYVALSYCWGTDTSKQLKTTKSNLEQHKLGIDWETIPSVIQDAITVAANVDQRFIWVDALCIVQDSLDDWDQEITRMGSIYAQSLFTIAATNSAGVSEGFLRTGGNARDTQHGILDWFEFKGKNSEIDSFILHAKHEVTDKIHQIEDAPWNKRAWTYQERLFSPRIVHFTKGQVYWECQEKFNCQEGLVTWSKARPTINRAPLTLDWHQFEGTPGEQHAGQGKDTIVDIWYNVISKDYSTRSLGVPADKLPAISALAMGIAFYMDEQYLAGHWLHALDTSLSWSRLDTSNHDKPGQELKNLNNGSPSWSWASRQGQVWWDESAVMHHLPFIATEEELLEQKLVGQPLKLNPRQVRDVIKVTEWDLQYKSNDTFGQVLGGGLALHARIKRSYVQDGGSSGIAYLGLQFGERLGLCCFDTDEIPDQVDVLFLLEKSWDGGSKTAVALLLRAKEGTPGFERIGLAKGIIPGWFDDVGVNKIVLV